MWFFPRKYKYRCIRVYVWFKDDKRHLNVNMIDAEKYQPARQNMKFVTRSLRSLATKLHILARLGRLIFSVSINSHPDNIYINSDDLADTNAKE